MTQPRPLSSPALSAVSDCVGPDPAADAAASLQFSGTPQRYLRISVLLSFAIHIWLYGGFSAIKYFVHGETWMFSAKPIVIAIGSMLLFARFAYRWMMRLDAQYGSGSNWRLVRQTVKLPELVSRTDKSRGSRDS